MMHPIRRPAALAVALLAAACSNVTAPRSDLLSAGVGARTVTLANRTDAPVSFLIATPRFLELADPLPCTRPEGCTPTLAAGAVVSIPFAEIPGWEPGVREAVVIHWRRPATAAALSPDSVRRITVRLR